MITQKTTIKTETVCSEDKTKRYSLSIEWDKSKKKAVVIMISAGQTNGVAFDNSTNLVLSNLVPLGYGSVTIVNLFATIGSGRAVIEKEQDEQNIKHIVNAATNADDVIFAVGTGHSTNKSFRERQKELLEQLTEYEDKLLCISDVGGQRFYHPLCPKVRQWILTPFKISELIGEKEAIIKEVSEGIKDDDNATDEK